MHVDPGIRTLGHHQLRLAVVDVDEIQVEPVLHAVHCHRPEQAVAHPSEARNQNVGILAQRQRPGAGAGDRDPPELASVGVHHCKAHVGIRIAGLRIFLLVHGRVQRNPIGDGIGRHFLLVHLEEGDLLSVWRPEVIAARVELFLVDPVDFAVQQIVVAIFGQGPLVSSAQRPHVQVVFADVRDASFHRARTWDPRSAPSRT